VSTEIHLDICTPEGKTWLARITGPDARFGVNREFVNATTRDLSRSGRTGTVTYLVEPGVYERREGRRSLGHRNGFFEVTGAGEIVALASAQEAVKRAGKIV
jgi:hypothetical protein